MQSHLAQLGFTKKPKMIPKVVRANLKKRMQQDERLAEIEAENARLLSQMTRIMDAPDMLSRLKKPPLSSLNVVTRRREMERVTHENMRMLRALEDTPSYYNHRVWMAERREQEHMLSYIGMYPYHDGTGVRSRTQMRSHTDVDDVWLRSVTSLSRKSALSLPELTKGRDSRFSRNDSPGEPWALPVLPGQEGKHGQQNTSDLSAPLDRSDLSGTTAPMRDAKSLDKQRADSSSESEGEEEDSPVKKADEPKPASQTVSQHKPSQQKTEEEETDSEDEAPAAARPAEEAAAAKPSTGESQTKPSTAGANAPPANDITHKKESPPPSAASPEASGETEQGVRKTDAAAATEVAKVELASVQLAAEEEDNSKEEDRLKEQIADRLKEQIVSPPQASEAPEIQAPLPASSPPPPSEKPPSGHGEKLQDGKLQEDSAEEAPPPPGTARAPEEAAPVLESAPAKDAAEE